MRRAWPDGLQPPALFAWMAFELFSLSLCEPVGLGCYWVDYSELWKWKRTSLTITNSGNSSSLFYPLLQFSLSVHKCKSDPLFSLLLLRSAHFVPYDVPRFCQMPSVYSLVCTGLQSHSGDLLSRLHLINPKRGLLASWDSLTLLGGPVEVSLHTTALNSVRHVLKMGRETLPTLM